MSEILIVYGSTDGHTRKISERMKQAIEQHGHRVTLAHVNEGRVPDLKRFDKVIVGGSVRYGTHGKAMEAFVRTHEAELNAKPNAFFSVNVVARKPEKRQPETNPYLQKFLQKITWRPKTLAVFAGKLDYPSMGFFDRIMIQLIMKMTNGPTDPKTVIDYTDWKQVEAFGHSMAQ